MQPKKKLAFLLAASKDLIFAAANVAIGLNRHVAADDFDIMIYANGGEEADLTALRRINHVTVVDYRLDPAFVETMLGAAQEGSRLRVNPSHVMAFSHFEIYSLLETHEKAVWLDVDMLVQDRIDPAGLAGPFTATLDAPWTVGGNFLRLIEGYRMDRPGICAAMIVVTDELPWQAMRNFCFAAAMKYADRLKNSDQGITNLALEEFKIAPKLLPLESWQCMAWRDESATAKIIHFGGSEKVWRDQNVCDAFPEWYRNHQHWQGLGGSAKMVEVGPPKKILTRLKQFDEIKVTADTKRLVDIEMVERLVHIEQKVDDMLRQRLHG